MGTTWLWRISLIIALYNLLLLTISCLDTYFTSLNRLDFLLTWNFFLFFDRLFFFGSFWLHKLIIINIFFLVLLLSFLLIIFNLFCLSGIICMRLKYSQIFLLRICWLYSTCDIVIIWYFFFLLIILWDFAIFWAFIAHLIIMIWMF